jgi:predicted nucleotidyltransferase
VRLDCFGVPVELFVPWHPFDHEVLRSALPREVGGRSVKVHRPEHLLVYKKVFDRSKDIEDIKAILVANAGKLHVDLIRRWAGELLDGEGVAEMERRLEDFYR